jgi:hypothetical protein
MSVTPIRPGLVFATDSSSQWQTLIGANGGEGLFPLPLQEAREGSAQVSAVAAVTASGARVVDGAATVTAVATVTAQGEPDTAGATQDEGGHGARGYGAQYWRTVRANREKRRELEELYAEARREELAEADEDRIEAIIEPFAPALRMPPAAQVDWAAMPDQSADLLRQVLLNAIAAAAAYQAAQEAARIAYETELDDEDEILLLLAA